jgi:hypothetical protein
LGGLEDEEVGLPAVGTDEEEFMYNIEEVMSLSFAFPPSPFLSSCLLFMFVHS